jgi:GTPase SAR1 family protein
METIVTRILLLGDKGVGKTSYIRSEKLLKTIRVKEKSLLSVNEI